MPLKLSQFKDPAVLNRWADGIEQRLDAIPPPKPVPKPVQFKTNSVSNKSQGILNLIAGNNITLTPDLFGNTIVAASTGGPNLALGDAIDFPQIDPASFILVDDFGAGTNGSGAIGSLSWAVNIGTGGAVNTSQAQVPGIGSIRLASGTTTGSGVRMALTVNQISGSGMYAEALPLLDYPGWKLVFIFRPLRATYSGGVGNSFDWGKKQSFYIGFAFQEQVNARPSVFAGLRLDTDTTSPSINDSTFWFECVSNNLSSLRNNTQGNTHNTGVTPVEFQEYRLEITCTVVGKLNFSLNGSTPVTLDMPSYKVGTGGGSSTIQEGIGNIGYVGGGSFSANAPFAIGSIIHVSGATLTHVGVNGDHVVLLGALSADSFLAGGANTLSSQTDPITAVGFPALCPYVAVLNDTSATPTSKQADIDFFLLLYNPKLAASFTGIVSNPLLPRYYIAQT